MSDAQYGLFLSASAGLCAIGAVINLLRLKQRGHSALILSTAFLALGALLWIVKSHGAQPVVSLLGILVAALLVADVVVRSRQRERSR